MRSEWMVGSFDSKIHNPLHQLLYQEVSYSLNSTYVLKVKKNRFTSNHSERLFYWSCFLSSKTKSKSRSGFWVELLQNTLARDSDLWKFSPVVGLCIALWHLCVLISFGTFFFCCSEYIMYNNHSHSRQPVSSRRYFSVIIFAGSIVRPVGSDNSLLFSQASRWIMCSDVFSNSLL